MKWNVGQLLIVTLGMLQSSDNFCRTERFLFIHTYYNIPTLNKLRFFAFNILHIYVHCARVYIISLFHMHIQIWSSSDCSERYSATGRNFARLSTLQRNFVFSRFIIWYSLCKQLCKPRRITGYNQGKVAVESFAKVTAALCGAWMVNRVLVHCCARLQFAIRCVNGWEWKTDVQSCLLPTRNLLLVLLLVHSLRFPLIESVCHQSIQDQWLH